MIILQTYFLLYIKIYFPTLSLFLFFFFCFEGLLFAALIGLVVLYLCGIILFVILNYFCSFFLPPKVVLLVGYIYFLIVFSELLLRE